MSMRQRYLPLVLLLVCVTFIALAPALQEFGGAHNAWRGVIPEYPKDATFYLARMAQISHGYFFVGNPYIREYKSAPALSFFVADWLAAAPLLLGISLTATVLWNAAFWSLLFCVVAYLVFMKLGLKPWESALATLLSFLQVYWLMLRPVAMQTVFPSYLLFMLAYLQWFRRPDGRKQALFLAVSAAVTFYIYTYLWQIVCITFAFTYGYLAVRRQWNSVRSLVISNIGTAVLAVPMLLYTVKQATSQFYWETLVRVNLVFTRLPTSEVYYYGRWVILGILLCLIFRPRTSDNVDAAQSSNLFAVTCITGVSLLVASASNVILNKEVDTATHIGRFIILWFSIVFCVLLSRFRTTFVGDVRVRKAWKIGVSAVLIIVCVGYARNAFRAIAWSNVVPTNVAAIQDYAIPLLWLNEHTAPEQVVWVLNPNIANYVPMLTSHFVLFHVNAASYLMPSSEIEERFLVSHFFDDLSLVEMKRVVSEYAGAGVRSQYQAHNRWVWTCKTFSLNALGYRCGKLETESSMKGDAYFADLYNQYLHRVVPGINSELSKFHVSYLLIDRATDRLKRPLKSIKGLILVYKDARFEIYSIPQNR